MVLMCRPIRHDSSLWLLLIPFLQIIRFPRYWANIRLLLPGLGGRLEGTANTFLTPMTPRNPLPNILSWILFTLYFFQLAMLSYQFIYEDTPCGDNVQEHFLCINQLKCKPILSHTEVRSRLLEVLHSWGLIHKDSKINSKLNSQSNSQNLLRMLNFEF